VTHNFGATNQQAKLHTRLAAAWLSRTPKLKISFGASDGERGSVLISSSVRAIVNEHLLRRLIQKLGSGRAVVDLVSSHATCCNDSEVGKQGHCNPEDIRHLKELSMRLVSCYISVALDPWIIARRLPRYFQNVACLSLFRRHKLQLKY